MKHDLWKKRLIVALLVLSMLLICLFVYRKEILLDCIARRNYQASAFLLSVLSFDDINNSRDWWGLTPMHLAAREGNDELAAILIKRGVNVNAKTYILPMKECSFTTPLHLAVEKNRKEIAELLILNGAVINSKDHNDRTPMERAKPEMKEYLISRGLYKEDRRKQTESLSQIVYELYNWNSQSIKTGERLISEGYDVNERDSDGISPAGWAVIKNNIEALKFFIKNKAILNVQDNCGKTPLHFVVETGDKDIMELLLQNGANPNIRDIYGRTPLFYLARKNSYKDESCLKKLRKIMKSYGAK